MRRCPSCTTLVDGDGACPACGHWPNRPTAAPPPRSADPSWFAKSVRTADLAAPMAVVAERGRRTLAARRPDGVTFLGGLGIAMALWTLARALAALFLLLRFSRRLSAFDPEFGRQATGLGLALVLLVFLVGTAILLVSIAFLRGSAWAFWVFAAYNALGVFGALQTAVVLPWALVPHDAVQSLAWLVWVVATVQGACLAYLALPGPRAYFFPDRRAVRAAPV